LKLRGARRALERRAPQEGDRRLVRVRHPRHPGRRGGRPEDAGRRGHGQRRVAARDRIVEAAGFPEQTGESVLVQGKGDLKVGDARFSAVVRDVVDRLQRTEGVAKVESPLAAENACNVSKDGRSVLVTFELPGDEDKAADAVEARSRRPPRCSARTRRP
jgi:hypothetical protein